MEASVAFYENLFGTQVKSHRPGHASFDLSAPSLFLVLDEKPRTGVNADHFGVLLASETDLDEAAVRLQRAGIASTREGFKIWLRDPDGNDWEFFILPTNPQRGSVRSTTEAAPKERATPIAVLSLVPLRVVRDAAGAIAFYERALGARELVRFIRRKNGSVSHADLAIGEAVFSVTEEARAWNSDAPPSLGGSPVILQLRVVNVDAVFETMCAAGDGRLRDR